ncbi:MAG: AMP-binding protein [Ectothiorhodospiraceae bacterium]|nr:AMP-binding protein [Ectothiorhodospiraceae bacterium]
MSIGYPDTNLSLWRADDGVTKTLNTCLGDALSHAAKQWPDTEAVVYSSQPETGNVRWTYRELDTLSGRLARAMLARGYAQGDRVAVWAPNHPQWILLEYALARAGLIIVALNPLYKQRELAFALNASQVKGVFHADQVGDVFLRDLIDQVRTAVPTLRYTHSLSAGIDALLEIDDYSHELPLVRPEDVLMIQYTSGTTGQPKAPQISHSAVTSMAKHAYQRWGFGPGDRVCHGFPLFHVGGSGNSTPGAMMVGATTLPLYIFKAHRTLDILEQERCTGFIGVPTMLQAMLNEPGFSKRDLSALKVIIMGGAPVPLKLLRECESAFGARILNGYGQTESSGVISTTVTDDSPVRRSETSGRALPGVSLKVVDEQRCIVPHGTMGELCYRGPGRMLGYRNIAEEQQPFDADGWLFTGDLATMDAEGFIRIVGRTREMIIRGGENLSPAEIEDYLLEHSAIDQAAVIGLPSVKYGEEVCAVLISNKPEPPSVDALIDWCHWRMSRWKVPRYIVFVDDFPTTPSGKVRKFLLKEQMIQHLGLATEQPQEQQSQAER